MTVLPHKSTGKREEFLHSTVSESNHALAIIFPFVYARTDYVTVWSLPMLLYLLIAVVTQTA